jgi:phosphatidate cytidylyltransferase
MEHSGAGKWRDLGLRMLSALILVPVVLAATWAGGVWFTLLVAVLGVAIAHEWSAILHEGDPKRFVLHVAAAISGALLPSEAGIMPALVFLAVLFAIALIVDAGDRRLSWWNSLGIPYIGLPAVALVVLRADPLFGMKAIFWLLSIVWASDTAAYFAGRLIGGPKLAPVISPNKTWAGATGALAGSVIIGALLGYALVGAALAPAILAVVLSIIAQAGDLLKSALKRQHGLKDSGTLIPGHGGILDRVDGVVAAASAAAIIGIIRAGPDIAAQGLLAW